MTWKIDVTLFLNACSRQLDYAPMPPMSTFSRAQGYAALAWLRGLMQNPAIEREMRQHDRVAAEIKAANDEIVRQVKAGVVLPLSEAEKDRLEADDADLGGTV